MRCELSVGLPLVIGCAACSGSSAPDAGPETGITAAELGVIVNSQDPQSVAVASYYQHARRIPAANVFTVSFTQPDAGILDDTTFDAIKAQVDGDAGANIQAYAVTWTFPYGVASDAGCTMGLSAALTFGFATQWCNLPANQGNLTAPSPYYDSDSTAPFTDLGIRPSMSIAGTTPADAEALIDRGVAADGAHPRGTAYLVETGDPVRSDRNPEYTTLAAGWDAGATGVALDIDDTSSEGDYGELIGQSNVLFYFIGAFNVPELNTNHYLPGAIGDDDTSFEGIPGGIFQTNCLQWLAAGVVGTYGTVVEPGAPTIKMSDVSVLIPRYVSGESLIEAYWKSVKYPGEGLFAGEPLARPFWGLPPSAP